MSKIFIPTSRLAKATKALLRARPRDVTLSKIASETPLTLNWLKYFSATDDGIDAAVSRIETLYEYLTQSKLDLIEPPRP